MKIFPKLTHHNSRLYLAISILQNLWFVEAVWYFFFVRFVSYFEIGIIFAISTLVGIVAEIPTGIFADRYGRKKAVVVGTFILTCGWILMATTTGFWQFLIGSIMSSIGRAFTSGALEAIVYDSLPKKTKKTDYPKLITLTDQLTTIFFAITVLIGGYLYSVHFRLPHLLFALANLIAFIFALFLKQDQTKNGSFSNKENAFANNLIGFKELSLKSLRPFILPSISTLAVFYLYDWGFSKPTIALNFGYKIEGQAIIYATMAMFNVAGISLIPKLRKKIGDRNGLVLLNIVMGIGFLLGSYKLGYPGLLALIGIDLAGYVSKPWISIIINERVSSQFRATTLSTLEFISKLPFVFTNIILGSFLDSGSANVFHRWVGVVMIILITGVLLFSRKDVGKK